MEIDSPNILGITTLEGNLTVTGTTSVKALSATTLNLTTIGSGTSVNNLGIDALGNIVSGNTSQNWVLGNSYTSGTTVINNGIIYQSNGTIPSGTTFSLGTTGATWKQVAADGNSNYSSGKFYSSGATASVNGIIYRANNDIPSGTTFSVGTTGTTWVQSAADANATWSSGKTYSAGSLVVNNKGVLYQANSIIPSGTTFSAGTSGATWNEISRTGKYAYWAPYVAGVTSTPLDTGAVTYIAPNAQNLGNGGLQLTNINSDGQSSLIAWNITNVDFTQDFRMSATIKLDIYGTEGNTGDGFVLFAGGSDSTTTVYGGGTTNNALNFNLITYPGNPNQTLYPAGASIWYSNTKTLQGLTGQVNFTSQFITYVIEVSRDKVTNRRYVQVYMTRTDNIFGGKAAIAGGDVTDWVPGGGFCGLFTGTGAARETLTLAQITFESM